MTEWTCVLQLDSQRKRISGSEAALRDAIYAGADLRVGTEFLHNEHVDIGSECEERVREVMDFRVTYLLDRHWVAGVETLAHVGPLAAASTLGKVTLVVVEPLSSVAVKTTV